MQHDEKNKSKKQLTVNVPDIPNIGIIKQFKPTIGSSMIGPHIFTKRYLKCPHCQQKSWAKETWNINKNQ